MSIFKYPLWIFFLTTLKWADRHTGLFYINLSRSVHSDSLIFKARCFKNKYCKLKKIMIFFHLTDTTITWSVSFNNRTNYFKHVQGLGSVKIWERYVLSVLVVCVYGGGGVLGATLVPVPKDFLCKFTKNKSINIGSGFVCNFFKPLMQISAGRDRRFIKGCFERVG